MKSTSRLALVVLALLASGDLEAQIVNFEGKLLAPDKVPGADTFGGALAVEGARVVVGAPFSDILAVDQGSVYVFDSLILDQKLQSTDGGTGDHFGESVALSGNTIAIGASRHASQAPVGGAVYVYDRTTSWLLVQKITPPVPAQGMRFGASVALSGDALVVGAPGDNEADAGAGAAYVYRRSAGVWAFEQKLLPPSGDPSAAFGCSVAVDATTALVGSFGAGPTDAGAAYAYTFAASSWTLQATLTAADASTGDYLGWAVALQQDTAVVGAPFDDSPIADAGSSYVFTRSGVTWSQQQRLTASDATADDQFGTSVSISGQTALVGSRFGNALGNNAGGAYAFVRSGSTWSQQQKLASPSDPTGDDYGTAVAVSGDTAWVGAPRDDPQGVSDAGTAYRFERSGATWGVGAPLVSFGGAEGDLCGRATGASSLVLAVACDQSDLAVKNGGAVYIWDRSGVQVTPRQTLLPPNATPGVGFGSALSVDDGALAAAETANLSNAAVHVYRRQGSGAWLLEQSIAGPGPGTAFGSSVAIDEGLLAVGAATALNGGVATGAVHLFRKVGAVWIPEATVFPPDGAAGDAFGVAVDVDAAQDLLVVGAMFHGGANAGAAYVYQRLAGTWTFQGSLSGANGGFGRSVAIGGALVAVGAPDQSVSGSAQGAVRVFSVSTLSLLAELSPNDLQAGDKFGYAMALDGDLLVAGAFAQTALQGAAYVFERTGATTWAQRLRLTAPDGGAGDYYGSSVALHGRSIVVGASQDNQLAFLAGGFYRYAASGDLSTSKSNGAAQVTAGQVTTYTMQIINPGPSDASPTVLSDPMPAQCDEFSWSCTPSGGASCAANGFGSIAEPVSLPPGSSLVVAAQCLLSSAATGTLANTVSVAPPYGWIDPDLANNSATDSDPITPVPVELMRFTIE